MRRPFPCLWFDGNAEEAARFYTSLLPDSSVVNVWRLPRTHRVGQPAWC